MNGNEEVFPRNPETHPDAGIVFRDWLAWLAMQGILAHQISPRVWWSTVIGEKPNDNANVIAAAAYRMADAMIKESSK